MYRTKEQILEALISGNTTTNRCRNNAYLYRKKKDFDNMMMFIWADEMYKMFHKGCNIK